MQKERIWPAGTRGVGGQPPGRSRRERAAGSGTYRGPEFVPSGVDVKVVLAPGVEVVRVHAVAPHRGRHGEGPDAGHHVAHGLPRPELLHQSPVLGLQAGVPVHLGVVEAEPRPVLPHLRLQVGVPGNHLQREGAERVGALEHADLVHHRAKARPVLVQQHLADQALERQVLVPQVQVRDVAHRLERRRHIHPLRQHPPQHLLVCVVLVAQLQGLPHHLHLYLRLRPGRRPSPLLLAGGGRRRGVLLRLLGPGLEAADGLGEVGQEGGERGGEEVVRGVGGVQGRVRRPGLEPLVQQQ